MHHHRTLTLALAAAMLTGVTTGCGSSGDHDAKRTASAFLRAWQSGSLDRAASLTDDPKAARAAMDTLRRNLRVDRARMVPGQEHESRKHTTVVPFSVALHLSGSGTWRYRSSAEVQKVDGAWRVHFSPALLHPKLRPGTDLTRSRSPAVRAEVLAADGTPLTGSGRVWNISIRPDKVTHPARVQRALESAGLGVEMGTGAFRRRLAQAEPGRVIPVASLRDDAYRRVSRSLRPIPGLQVVRSPRAVSGLAGPVVGSVQPATEATLANAGPRAASTEAVGATGLQYRYQRQLGGVPGTTITLVDATTRESLGEVHRSAPRPGTPIRTTLVPDVQRAAEAALGGVSVPVSLVAIRPSTGEVLAAANSPDPGDNRAFTGRYPPGSTFKVVTTAALIQAGVDGDTPAPCPQTVSVDGQKFENQGEYALPDGTKFEEDFAKSCNTGFLGLRDRLDKGALTAAAKQFGIGGAWQVGASTFDGSVPAPENENEKAATMIGQGRVEVSPLVMASVAATVKDGRFRQPVLVPQGVQRRHRPGGHRLDPAVAGQLRTLMRGVVRNGSGHALKGLSGNPGAKTGTAEYGTSSPPRTHAWMLGFRGDVAFAVMLEGGGSGGRDAGPVAARFLRALD